MRNRRSLSLVLLKAKSYFTKINMTKQLIKINMYNYTIIGGGIVGLSTAMALSQKFPHSKIALLEKEAAWASHQTGHNSGIIHSGIYYKPGSYKAQLCYRGNRSMVDFCQQHDIPYKLCGKVIVATEPHELPPTR